jgi:hypothetical protein
MLYGEGFCMKQKSFQKYQNAGNVIQVKTGRELLYKEKICESGLW